MNTDTPVSLETDRLILRQWIPSDVPDFRKMGRCDEVMKYFPKKLSEEESDHLASKLSSLIAERGWGLWAVEEKASKRFTGFTGLHYTPDDLPFSPALEIGYRFSKDYWGKGFATEAASRVLDFAFRELKVEEIVSFTSVTNVPSQRVMERIGLINSKSNFLHPKIPNTSPLQEHVLYTLTNHQCAQA